MGRDKTQLELHDETLLCRAYRRFSEVFENVLVSVASTETQPAGIPSERLICDIIPNLGPVSGLHAALTRYEAVFLVAADMPVAEPSLALRIVEAGLAAECDAASGAIDGFAEPTFTLYKKSILPELASAIERGDYGLSRILRRMSTKLIEIPSETLLNVNCPEDYEILREKYANPS